MSKVVATTVLPEDSGEILTFGDAGDAIAISGDSLNLNVLQDAGGNNIFTSNGSGTITSTALGGAYKLLDTNTFTGAASSAFTSLIDSTYDVYFFSYIAINPATDQTDFTFQCSIDGGSNYNVTQTTAAFQAYHTEDGTASSLGYNSGEDIQNGTGYQVLAGLVGNGADENASGELYLFTPSNTSNVKHWHATTNFYRYVDRTNNSFFCGYFNTTSAINAISFKMSSGNMDGEIKMYGISKS